MLFRPLYPLALAPIILSACGVGEIEEKEIVVTTSPLSLFPEQSGTTTLPPLDIPGWEIRELSELQEKKVDCLSQLEFEDVIEESEEGPKTVRVEPGDTLGEIAKRFEMTVDDFMRANSMSDANKLKVGQNLVIPRVVLEERVFPEGPTVLTQSVSCNIDSGLVAFGPDLEPLGSSGKIEVYISWPRLEGPREAPKVNGRLRGLVQSDIRIFLDEIINQLESNGYACRSFIDRCMWLQERYEVILATDKFFSVRNNRRILFPTLVVDESEIRTETFDLLTGETIEISDLFNPNTDWVSALSEISIAKLQNEKWTDERMFDGAGPNAVNFERFNLTRGGLVLSFAPSTIGGDGTNDTSITIPFGQLETFWNINGPMPMLAQS